MVAQTIPVIIGEVFSGLAVALISFLVKRWWAERREENKGLVSSLVGDNTTNSPIAVGGTVHQSTVYNTLVPVEAVKPAPEKDSTPSPREVLAYYRGLNPYQMRQGRDHHKGISFHWKLKYGSTDSGPDEDGNVRISAKPSEGWIGIYFKVNLADFPEFKIADSGQRFWVDGTIDEVGGDTVIYVTCKAIRWEYDDAVQ
jgi:hypothetical protein